MTMYTKGRQLLYDLLRWSERYTKIDMVYFASGNFWLNFGRIISIGTGLLLTVAFANFLTPEAFGTYKYVLAAAGFVGTFSLTGLGTALMRAVAQGKRHVIPAVVKTGMLWNIPASIVAFAIGIYYFVHTNNDLGFAFVFIAFYNTLSGGLGLTKSVWTASGNFKLGTMAGIPRSVFPIAVILLTLLFTKNVVWIVFAYFVSNVVITWILYLWMLRKLHVQASMDDVPETVRYGKQLSFLGFFQIASGQVDQLLLFHFFGPAQLVLYTLGFAPVNEAGGFINNFLTILFNKLAVKTKAEVHETLFFRMRQMFFISCAVVLIYVVLVPFLFKYLFPKYLASAFVSQVLSLTILFQFKGVIDVYYNTHGEIKKRTAVITITQIIEFGLLFTLIPLYGLWGAVAAAILSEALAAITYLGMYLMDVRSHRKQLGLSNG
jgi:O-antigen/teichoic acid export membrane protein